MGRGRASGEQERTLAFRCYGEERHADLLAPVAVRRGGRRVVPLVDLWVASGLPGHLLDLVFAIETCDAAGGERTVLEVDAQRFARGYVTLGSRELWWPDAADAVPGGRVVRAVTVRWRCSAVLGAFADHAMRLARSASVALSRAATAP